MPRFCIVVPSSNSVDTLKQAVESAINQDYDDYAVYVSDNGSTDGSVDSLVNVSSPRLTAYSHGERVGKSANWNRAYHGAPDCEFFVNLHSDDILNPNLLRQIDRAVSPKTVLIHGAAVRVGYDGTTVLHRRKFPLKYRLIGENQRTCLLLGNMVGIVGTTIRRDAFESVGGWNCKFDFFQDVDLWYELADLGSSQYLPINCGCYRAPFELTESGYLEEALDWYSEKVELRGDIEKKGVAWYAFCCLVKHCINQRSITGFVGKYSLSELVSRYDLNLNLFDQRHFKQSLIKLLNIRVGS